MVEHGYVLGGEQSGRIILRESGTEPVIRVMAEVDSDELCRKYVREMVEVINSIL